MDFLRHPGLVTPFQMGYPPPGDSPCHLCRYTCLHKTHAMSAEPEAGTLSGYVLSGSRSLREKENSTFQNNAFNVLVIELI